MRRPVVESGRIEVCSVRPNQRMHLRINSHLIEHRQVPQRAEKLASQNTLQVDRLLRAVIEKHTQRVRSLDLNRFNSIDGMGHLLDSPNFEPLIQGIDWQWRLAGLESLPVSHQLLLM